MKRVSGICRWIGVTLVAVSMAVVATDVVAQCGGQTTCSTGCNMLLTGVCPGSATCRPNYTGTNCVGCGCLRRKYPNLAAYYCGCF